MNAPRDLNGNVPDNQDVSDWLAEYSAMQSPDDAVLIGTLDGVNLGWNAAAERLFGYSREEMIRRHVSVLVPADRLDEALHILERVASGETVNIETVRLDKKGRRLPVALTVSPLKGRHTPHIVAASVVVRLLGEHELRQSA